MLCATAIGENAKEKNFARSDFSAPIAEEIVKNNRGKYRYFLIILHSLLPTSGIMINDQLKFLAYNGSPYQR